MWLGDLNRDIKTELTKNKLRVLKKKTRRSFRMLNSDNKQKVLHLTKELKDTRDVHKIDVIVDKLSALLRLPYTPLECAWDRKYNAFFGYKYVCGFAFEYLYSLTDR